MAQVMFYHLQRARIEDVLPPLLEKCLERDWRAVVQAGSQERLEALDMHLWTYRDEAFLPHGTARDGAAEEQPVFLTSGDDNPNGAAVRFLVDGAELPDLSAYERVVYLFDGADEEALARARQRWLQARAAGHEVTYWQQTEAGRWEKRA